MLTIETLQRVITEVPIEINGAIHLVPTSTPLGKIELEKWLLGTQLRQQQKANQHLQQQLQVLQQMVDTTITYLDIDA